MASPTDSQLAAQLGLGMRIASPGRGRGVGRRRSVWACGARLASASEAQRRRGMRVAAPASAASAAVPGLSIEHDQPGTRGTVADRRQQFSQDDGHAEP